MSKIYLFSLIIKLCCEKLKIQDNIQFSNIDDNIHMYFIPHTRIEHTFLISTFPSLVRQLGTVFFLIERNDTNCYLGI